MEDAQKSRILETLEQYDRPVALETLSSWTNVSTDQLKSFLDDQATNEGVQKIGANHYRFMGTQVPQEGDSFDGKVTGTSFKGGAIVRDQSGTSWRIEPV